VLNAGVSMGVLAGTAFTVLVITALVTTAMAGSLLSARAADSPARPAQFAGVVTGSRVAADMSAARGTRVPEASARPTG
jgi:hypothetical protein